MMPPSAAITFYRRLTADLAAPVRCLRFKLLHSTLASFVLALKSASDSWFSKRVTSKVFVFIRGSVDTNGSSCAKQQASLQV